MSALSDALNEANVDQLSMREIARRSGDRVSHSALGKYFKPTHGRPGEDVLEVFSEVLHIPMPRLRQLADLPAGEGEAYEPPREANRLDRRQRRLVDELIKVLAESKGGEGDVDRDAPSIVAEPQKPRPNGLVVGYVGSGKTGNLVALLASLPADQRDVILKTTRDAMKKTAPEIPAQQVDMFFNAMVEDLELGMYEDLAARPSTD